MSSTEWQKGRATGKLPRDNAYANIQIHVVYIYICCAAKRWRIEHTPCVRAIFGSNTRRCTVRRSNRAFGNWQQSENAKRHRRSPPSKEWKLEAVGGWRAEDGMRLAWRDSTTIKPQHPLSSSFHDRLLLFRLPSDNVS